MCLISHASARNTKYHSASGATSSVYGHEDTSKYPSALLQLAPGETITSAILYGDGHGTWLGHISLETSKGQKFEAGRDTSKVDPYGVNVGSGILLGAIVTPRKQDDTSPEDIANLALLFLGPSIDHITIQDIHFKEDPSGSSVGINPESVIVGQWFNHGNNPVSYSQSPTYTVTSSYS